MYAFLNVLMHLDQIQHSLLLTQGDYLYSAKTHIHFFTQSHPFSPVQAVPQKMALFAISLH